MSGRVVVQAVKENGELYELWLATDRLELDADLVAREYRCRWTIELFSAGSKASSECAT